MYSLSGVLSAQYSSQSLSVLLDNVIADSLVILMWKIGVVDNNIWLILRFYLPEVFLIVCHTVLCAPLMLEHKLRPVF